MWELKALGGRVVGRVLRSLKILGNGTKILLILEHFGAHARTADAFILVCATLKNVRSPT